MDVIWDNCAQYDKKEIEKIQLETARIATGTTKLISINTIYKETEWDTLENEERITDSNYFLK